MKAILLAGGKGTRLRPLTLHTPKPIVPIFNRPFLHYQIDLLRQIPEIDEIILSLNYQPRRIEDVFGDGSTLGIKIRYVVEPAPLGTGGAVRYAGDGADRFGRRVQRRRADRRWTWRRSCACTASAQARATIVLTPVDNPSAYGLVETDAGAEHPALPREAEARGDHHQLHQRRHLRAGARRRSTASRRTRRGRSSAASSRRSSNAARRSSPTRYDGYWIDIGTPEKYTQVHRDIMDGRYQAPPFAGQPAGHVFRGDDVRVEEGAVVEGPAFLDEGVVVRAGRTRRPVHACWAAAARSRRTRGCDGAHFLGRTAASAQEAVGGRRALRAATCTWAAARRCGAGAVLGDKTAITDYSRVTGP